MHHVTIACVFAERKHRPCAVSHTEWLNWSHQVCAVTSRNEWPCLYPLRCEIAAVFGWSVQLNVLSEVPLPVPRTTPASMRLLYYGVKTSWLLLFDNNRETGKPGHKRSACGSINLATKYRNGFSLSTPLWSCWSGTGFSPAGVLPSLSEWQQWLLDGWSYESKGAVEPSQWRCSDPCCSTHIPVWRTKQPRLK